MSRLHSVHVSLAEVNSRVSFKNLLTFSKLLKFIPLFAVGLPWFEIRVNGKVNWYNIGGTKGGM